MLATTSAKSISGRTAGARFAALGSEIAASSKLTRSKSIPVRPRYFSSKIKRIRYPAPSHVEKFHAAIPCKRRLDVTSRP